MFCDLHRERNHSKFLVMQISKIFVTKSSKLLLERKESEGDRQTRKHIKEQRDRDTSMQKWREREKERD